MSTRNEQSFNVWIVVRPAADVPGQWVAHCLDLDVVTYGNSLRHALDMVHEAARNTILDDLNSNQDPMDRRAPRECWDEMFKKLMPRAKRVEARDLVERNERYAFVIAQLTLSFVRKSAGESPKASKCETPVAFAESATPACI
ncbi:hypothetical protein [Anaeromyxobacter sp. SG66]|uniref:hypothetical protein n=1 Tax=Anaeromyxobacter sp. SG66 TaxID=2925410 RepID=UPI001F59AA47|nr:hypothetical protein [Anaeromyxobacter sp. SG66]